MSKGEFSEFLPVIPCIVPWVWQEAGPRILGLYCSQVPSTPKGPALHYTALKCTALHCTELYCSALHSTALYCSTLHLNSMYCTAFIMRHCSALHMSHYAAL